MAAQDRSGGVVSWGGVCVDCAPGDFEAEVAFYRDMLGMEVHTHEERWASLHDPRSGMWLNVQAENWYGSPVWPEQPGAQAKMMHFEMGYTDMEAAVALVIKAGGMVAPHQPAGRDPKELRVMLDPAGHPFCLCT